MENRIKRLKTEIFENINEEYTSVTDIEIKKGELKFPCDFARIDGFEPYTNSEVWSGENFDDYALFKFILEVPEMKEGYVWGLDIRTNKGNGHNMVRPQMLLFAENECICGLDTNHENIPLPSYNAGDKICFYVYAFSGLAAKTPYGSFVDIDTASLPQILKGDIKKADVVKEAYILNNPLFAISGNVKNFPIKVF